jgi:hypothetical protein
MTQQEQQARVPNVSYDSAEQVIFVDFTDSFLTSLVLEQVFADIIAVSQSLPNKVYLLACFQNAKLDAAAATVFSDLSVVIFSHVLGMVRYAVGDLMANVTIRSTTVKQHLQGTQSHIYKNRAEALAAIHQLQQKEREV